MPSTRRRRRDTPSPQPLTNVRTQAPADKLDFELRGTLSADYTYAHTATKRQSVSIVMATWDSESAQMACAVVPPDGTRLLASVLIRHRRDPQHDTKRRHQADAADGGPAAAQKAGLAP